MRVHLVQFDIAWEEPERNYAAVRRLVGGAAVEPGDLIVLPEMFDTGFSFAVERTADESGRSRGFLAELAREHGATVVGGVTVREGSGARNRAVVFGPGGTPLMHYDKTRLFPLGTPSEASRFSAGPGEVGCFVWNGVRVAPLICYDLRFPELFLAGLRAGAEVFVVIANWLEHRHAHWRALAVARAIENQAYVVAVNRCGKDPVAAYMGESLVLSPRGEVVAEGGRGDEVVSAVVDAAEVRTWREKLPAWRERLGM
ncbi:MAG: nitrilase-related carbon-nitrogen hydrolase [Planctomycetota bacterium]|nr:nitrilase-related carbon-nitrogen hydrolase [Planctomycetota bacterium]